jgi:hypothetical protein
LELPATQTQTTTYTSDVHIIAKRAAADFTPEGNLNNQAWKDANWVEFSHGMSGKANHPEQATRIASLWTDKYIYFALSCKYDALNVFEGEDLSKERWELWNRDVAEVFLNPQPERQLLPRCRKRRRCSTNVSGVEHNPGRHNVPRSKPFRNSAASEVISTAI